MIYMQMNSIRNKINNSKNLEMNSRWFSMNSRVPQVRLPTRGIVGIYKRFENHLT